MPIINASAEAYYADQIGDVPTHVEEWRPVVGYEGYYSASSLGRIRRDAGGSNNAIIGRVLRPTKNQAGYPLVSITRHGVKRSFTVHRLVITAFLGMPPIGMECCHRDGNKNNNAISNLRWGTRQDNMTDRDKHGATARGRRNPRTKLDEDSVREIRELIAEGRLSLSEIGRRYGVGCTAIRGIRNGEIWRWLR